MRNCGVLAHVTSLGGSGFTGTLAGEAYRFIDWLQKAGMSVWQVLPVGPTGYGDSPYQSPCTHAGNMYLIDLPALENDGLLSGGAGGYGDSGDDIETGKKRKLEALKQSFRESYPRVKGEVDRFLESHSELNDYALFMAVKDHFGGVMWTKWDDAGIRMRDKDAIERYSKLLSDEIDFYKYTQYLFFRQWRALKEYANERGVSIFGDMPIYVAEDSSDTWANPDMFALDEDRRPVKVAGVPPDYFSEDGQLWGNPIYDWKTLKKSGYGWWLKRLSTASEMYDMLRVDHFIGFANYYAIKAGAKNARVGKWEKAPGFSFFRKVKRRLPDLNVIAEDLGEVNGRVRRLKRYTGYPGMKVLCFGFDSDEKNPHFVKNVVKNSICYTGTHDNDTVLGWWDKAKPNVKEFALKNLPQRENIADAMMEAALASPAKTAVLPMQDILHLGGEARMNMPGTVGGANWRWRMDENALTDELAEKLRKLNETYERISK